MTNGNAKNGAVCGAIFRRVTEGVLALTAGVGAGAGLMYLCDPHRGRERRNRLMEQASGLLHRNEVCLEKRGKDLWHRMQGAAAEAASALGPDEDVTDEVLAARVRSRLGQVVRRPRDVRVLAQNGVVTLEGKLTHAEKRRLTGEVERIAGVKGVNDLMTSRLSFAPGMVMGLAAGLAMLRRESSR